MTDLFSLPKTFAPSKPAKQKSNAIVTTDKAHVFALTKIDSTTITKRSMLAQYYSFILMSFPLS